MPTPADGGGLQGRLSKTPFASPGANFLQGRNGVSLSKTEARKSTGGSSIHAVERAIAILRTFSPEAPSLGVSDLARRVGLHKSTVHRLLATLERQGFVVQDAAGGQYRLGLQLLELGTLVLAGIELRKVARRHLEEVHHACGETVHLAILDEGEVVYIDKLDGTRGVRMYSSIGRRSPAHCTGLGKALLAWQPAGVLEQIIQRRGLLAYTSRTITSPETLRDHLALVRLRGYAIDNGEHEEFIRCAAAPVFDHTGQVAAAVSIAAVGVDVESPRFQEFASLVQQSARTVSETLGHGRVATTDGGVHADRHVSSG